MSQPRTRAATGAELRYGREVAASIGSLALGFRGLALLRGWPFQDPGEAAAEVAAIARVCSRSDEPAEFEVDVLNVREAYAAWSATYDSAPTALIAAEEPVVRAFLEGIAPGQALDVACGTGRLSAMLRERGHHVVAVDSSTAMLGRARANQAAEALACADLLRLPFRDTSVDVVVCGLALTHARELAPPLAEIARVVRPGGYVVVSDVIPSRSRPVRTRSSVARMGRPQ